MQCFDTFRGFLHKIYAATIDGKGREGTYIFFLTTTGAGGSRRQGIGHSRAAAPCHPAGAAHAWNSDSSEVERRVVIDGAGLAQDESVFVTRRTAERAELDSEIVASRLLASVAVSARRVPVTAALAALGRRRRHLAINIQQFNVAENNYS